ncbi:relaxase/mobilization nuclease domain-containing protein, partial [Peribacillus castrilensis]
TPELANQIGQDLAREVAKGHECVVYTHTDKAHIHNHIVINAVSYEDGSKYQSSKKDLYNIREQSDRLCLERGLSVVKEPSAHTRYTLAEKSLLDKGKDSWKDEIRESIDHIKEKTHSLDDLADKLKKEFAIETKITQKNISFKHPDSERFVRGTKLGLAYEKETLANEFERKIERGQERGNTDISDFTRAGHERTRGTDERDERTERSHEKLHQSSHGQRRDEPNDDRSRTIENQENQSRGSGKDDFDFDKARRHAEKLRQSTSEAYGRWQERDGGEQSKDPSKNERNRGNAEQQHEANEPKNERKHERIREQSDDYGRER